MRPTFYLSLLLLFCTSLGLIPSGAQAQNTGSLTGQVLDEAQMPVAGAAVTLPGVMPVRV